MRSSFQSSLHTLPQGEYYAALYQKYLFETKASLIDLKDPSLHFFTSADFDRKTYLRDLPPRDEFKGKGPKLVTVEMNAGLGSSLGVTEANASKASGVRFVAGSKENSILQAKLAWYAKHADRFTSLAIQPWNNHQTSLSWDAVLTQNSDLAKQLEKNGVKIFDHVLQAMFPRLKKDEAVPVDFGAEEKQKAPGGHGQVLFQLYLDGLLERFLDDGYEVLVMANTDGLNSTPDPFIADYMVKENILGGMVTTDRTPLDAKGGIVAIRDGKLELIERAQVLESQMNVFEHIGLNDGENPQPFNTNLIYINLKLLIAYLDTLRNQRGEEAVLAALTPDLIVNRKKIKDGDVFRDVIQLEGAIGSVVLRFPNVKLFNLPAAQRAEGFTPVKTPPDVVYLYDSDAFRFDENSSQLHANVQGTFAAFHLTEWNGWKQLEETRAAFGHPGMRDLKSLAVMGEVVFPDAIFRGVVEIINHTGQRFDFSQFPRADRESGRLVFDNVRVIIDASGVKYESLQP
ncbi:MAG: hypothetical protein COX62_08390 [Deltaproteobacteria bacterium CG_4_10_14_0_2_um_filter_43_8]|nr:MAG: hypothetical protein COV43_08070 [Deltaproteobacteria bacterium CG11_big_fil_rev_8_21_14_0_20_42_23]PJA18721.1 MAG: hypothetical protein COX62_08390 [Deltaproteobacteria bacterium CG_4_10_14_0_2_um_filter_43_8]PJC64604.1 MAG: hypothetical protein CO021_03290 [Deltaproteobacteria bacterium CG_4_9_14_0_2_um_filter_42_21]